MFRLYVLTFRGPSRVAHDVEHHIHEAPLTMRIPLVILAVLSVVGGFVGMPMIPGVQPFESTAMWFWRFWDEKIVDGTVNGIAYTLEGVSAVLRLFQTGFVGTYALFFTLGVILLLLHFLRHA